MNRQKKLTVLALTSVLMMLTMLVSAPILNTVYASHDKGNQKSKDNIKPKDKPKGEKSKPVKCNNVKILVKVSGIPKNTTDLVGNVKLKSSEITKTAHVEGDKHIAIPFQFKKLNPCPEIGASFSGDVNGTSFNGVLKSLKKPNKVSVSLP